MISLLHFNARHHSPMALPVLTVLFAIGALTTSIGAQALPQSSPPAASDRPDLRTPLPSMDNSPTPVRQKLAQAAPPAPKATKCRKARGRFFFRFENAKIFDVLKQVSHLTCKNFIISESIKGGKKELTIISRKQVSVDQAYAAFLSALQANNMALVRAGQFYKLVERKTAVKDALPMYTKMGDLPWYPDAQVTMLYELENTTKEQVQPILRNLMSKNSDLQIVGDNLLILTDSAANIRRLNTILEKIDVASILPANHIRVVDIYNAEAQQVATKLQDIFGKATTRKGRGSKAKARPKPRSGAAGKGNASDDVGDVSIEKIVADERTNRLIIIASDTAFERVKEVIEILDSEGDHGTEVKVFVLPLSNADSQKTASTLSSLAQGSSSRKSKKRKKGKNKDTASLFEGEVKVTADEATNSLVIIASQRDYNSLTKVVEQLDVRRPQVFVEAAILEVALTEKKNFKLDAYTGLPVPVPGFDQDGLGIVANQGGQTLVTSSAKALAAQSLFNGLNSSTLDASSLGSVVDATSSLENLLGWFAFRGPAIPGTEQAFGFAVPSFGVVMNALQTNANVDVLSTPHIMTTDNEKAEISVGQRIPVVRGISPGGGGGAGGFFGGLQQISYEDVKLKFTVTPHVNDNDDIRIEIEEEVSDLGGNVPVGNGLEQPIITNRSIKTTVVVHDQQTVVIGGLISKRSSDSESKFPLLGDLPIVGWLFKQWSGDSTKSNLILVLTPYVVRSREDFQAIYERKLKERTEFVDAFLGGANDYNPYIEYSKKTGPLALLLDDVAHEMTKLENGGAGLPNEVSVTPEVNLEPIDFSEPVAPPAPKAEAPSSDTPSSDTPSSDTPSSDTPKTDSQKSDATPATGTTNNDAAGSKSDTGATGGDAK